MEEGAGQGSLAMVDIRVKPLARSATSDGGGEDRSLCISSSAEVHEDAENCFDRAAGLSRSRVGTQRNSAKMVAALLPVREWASVSSSGVLPSSGLPALRLRVQHPGRRSAAARHRQRPRSRAGCG